MSYAADDVKRALKRLLNEYGYRNFKDASELLGIMPSTFSEHLSNFCEDQDYGSFFVLNLAKALKMRPEQLRLRLEANLTNELSREVGGAGLITAKARSEDGYRREIESRLEKLTEDDEYYFVTSDTPWEFTSTDFQYKVLAAIRNGVTIGYVFPEPEQSPAAEQRFPEMFSEFIGPANLSWTVLTRAYLNFCNLIMKRTSLAVSKIKDHLRCYTTTNPFLSSPLFNLSIFRLGNDDGTMTTVAYIELNVGHAAREARIWMPLSRTQTMMVERALLELIDEPNGALGRKIEPKEQE